MIPFCKSLCALLGITLMLSACGNKHNTLSDPHESEKIAIDTFSMIYVEGPVKVNYTQVKGRIYGELYNPGGLEKMPRPVIEGETLRIVHRMDTRKIDDKRLPVVNVYGPSVSRFEVKGRSLLIVSDMQADTDVDIVLSGGGTIDMHDIDALERIAVYNNGSGDISLKQVSSESLNLHLAGSGDIDVVRAGCTTIDALLTGSGDLEIKSLSCRDLAARLTGTGDIDLKGRCLKADYTVTSDGDLDAKELEAEEVTARSDGKGDLRCNAASLLRTNTAQQSIIEYVGNPRVEAKGRAPRRYR